MNKIIFITLFTQLAISAFSQCKNCEYEEGLLWVVIDKNVGILKDGSIDSEKEKSLDQILRSHNTTNFDQVFPASKTCL